MSRKTKRSFTQKVQQQINRNLERKHVGNTLNAISYDTTGTNYELTTLAQGDDTNQRTGREVRATSFRFDAVMHYADTTNIIRVILYIAKDNDDTLSGTTVYSLIDHDSFHVLHDEYYAVGNSGPMVTKIKLRKSWINGGKSRGMLLKYTSSASEVSVQNTLKMFIVSDSGASVHPTITGRYNLYFTDA